MRLKKKTMVNKVKVKTRQAKGVVVAVNEHETRKKTESRKKQNLILLPLKFLRLTPESKQRKEKKKHHGSSAHQHCQPFSSVRQAIMQPGMGRESNKELNPMGNKPNQTLEKSYKTGAE